MKCGVLQGSKVSEIVAFKIGTDKKNKMDVCLNGWMFFFLISESD